MPHAENGGVRVHYRVEGDGPPLVLQHGFTTTMRGWYETGVVDALKGAHRLVLVDARGHGGSDAPHDPEAYSMDASARDVLVVLDALGIDRAHYWGYSMGAHIGYALVARHGERLLSAVLGGRGAHAPQPDTVRSRIDAFAQGTAAWVAEFERTLGPRPSWRREEMLAGDVGAFGAQARAFAVEPGREHLLPAVAVPCLLYCGDGDPFHESTARAAAAIPGARFVSLPGLDHWAAFAASDRVLPHVRAFLAEVA